MSALAKVNLAWWKKGFHGFEGDMPGVLVPRQQGKEPSLSLLTITVDYQSMAMITYYDYSLIRARSGRQILQ